MPSFSTETWESFKMQFMSVIHFLLYSFDIFFDAVRANPLLYVFVFFPIFGTAFLIGLSLLTRIRVGSYNISSGGKSFKVGSLKRGIFSRKVQASSVNLANVKKGETKLKNSVKSSKLGSKNYSIRNNNKKPGINFKWKTAHKFFKHGKGKKSKDVNKDIEVDDE